MPMDNAALPLVSAVGRWVRLADEFPVARNGFVAKPAIQASEVADVGAVVPL